MKGRNSLLIIFCALLVFTACRKSERDNDTSTTSVQDHILTERLFNDLIFVVDEAARGTQGIKVLGCATITADTLSNPKTLIINFDSLNCTGDDGLQRSGIITASFTGKYLSSNTIVNINLTNYRVNEYRVDGSASITNRGTNIAGMDSFGISGNIEITDLLNQWESSWSFNQIRNMTAGQSTDEDQSDDVYEVTGSGTGTNRAGNSFSATIVQALTLNGNCEYVSAGVCEIKPTNISLRTVDYGSSCDNSVSVTINDDVIDVTTD